MINEKSLEESRRAVRRLAAGVRSLPIPSEAAAYFLNETFSIQGKRHRKWRLGATEQDVSLRRPGRPSQH